MNLYEIVRKLTGPINPVGDAGQDARRLENLKVVCELVNTLVADIDRVASTPFVHKASVNEAQKVADQFLTSTLGIKE